MKKRQKWTKDERVTFMTDFRKQLKENGLKSKLTLSQNTDTVTAYIQEQRGNFDRYAVIGPTGAILKCRAYTFIKDGELVHYEITQEQLRINVILIKILKLLSHEVTGYSSI